MPIYEYQCTMCGHQLEALQGIKEEPLTLCPKCQQPGLNKLVSAAGFQLKGTGWYKTDYSSKAKTSSEKESQVDGDKAKTEASENAAKTSAKQTVPQKETQTAKSHEATTSPNTNSTSAKSSPTKEGGTKSS